MRYDCQQISVLWSEKEKYQNWCNIEFAALKALKNIDTKYEIQDQDIIEIQELEKSTKHDVAAFVKWLENKFKDQPWSRYIHYGLTSSDIVDTSFSLTLYKVNSKINTLLYKMVHAITEVINKVGEVKIAGRTHGQIADEILLKTKLHNYITNLLNLSLPNTLPKGKLAGAVGDNKFFTKEKQEEALKLLNMIPSDDVDGQIIARYYFAKNVLNWSLLASYLEKLATDFRLLAQTEIGEVSEGFAKDQIGSSSMPHKRNPIGLENICGNARIIKNYAGAALDTITVWNERDISHSSMERTIYPNASNLLGYIIERFTNIINNMNFNTDIMNDRILEAEYINSQKEMLKKIESGISRNQAHREQSENYK